MLVTKHKFTYFWFFIKEKLRDTFESAYKNALSFFEKAYIS